MAYKNFLIIKKKESTQCIVQNFWKLRTSLSIDRSANRYLNQIIKMTGLQIQGENVEEYQRQ